MMLWEILLVKGAGALAVLIAFAGTAFLLRFLYGPKGKFREAAWDEVSGVDRLRVAPHSGFEGEEALRAAFLEYAGTFFSGESRDDAPLRLKADHSFRVLRYAEEIAGQEDAFADAGMARALRLAALFHDVGRFEQFRRFRTFADEFSCNHALLGAGILRERKFLADEARKTRGLVLAAVAAHNRFSVPKNLSGSVGPVLFGLRDADKLDIMRIMADNLAPGERGDGTVLLHLRDEPERCSPLVFRALREGRTALYRDMRYVNDFRILLCSWLYDLHFPAAYRIVRREGHLHSVIDGCDALPELQNDLRVFVDAFLSKGRAGSAITLNCSEEKVDVQA
ncbi:MAG: HD domain-containing protein [Desulfovibrio sp.]|jgi:putative nucleotidyltransferase with HDIG domain|nr:HD domain-containing protein [Desulfovibrio sp.]